MSNTSDPLVVAAEPCLRVHAARMLGRIRFRDDQWIEDALAALAETGPGDLRRVARESLDGLEAGT